MSGIEPFLLAASTALGAVSTISGVSQANQQKKAQAQAQALQAQQAQAQIADLERQRAQADKDRRDRLERATASQRAAFAGAGISSDGSGDAVFDNLLSQSMREKQDIDDKIDRSIRSLQDSIQLNLLKQPTSYDAFGKLASVASTGASFAKSAEANGWFKAKSAEA